jgi:hypothetical protein
MLMPKPGKESKKTSHGDSAKSIAAAKSLTSKLKAPSRRKKRKAKTLTNADLDILQTSPITVGGGGSVGIGFDTSHYQVETAGVYSHPTDELLTTLVSHQNGRPLRNFVNEVKGKICRVKISCLDSAGNDSPIEIESRRRGPLVIRFNESHFPYVSAQGVFYSASRKVSAVVVTSGGHSYPFPVPDDWKGVIWNDDL